MKNKIIFVILTILTIIGTSSVFAYKIDTIQYNRNFENQLYDNYQSRNSIYNSTLTTESRWTDDSIFNDYNYVIGYSNNYAWAINKSNIAYLSTSLTGGFYSISTNGTISSSLSNINPTYVVYHNMPIYSNSSGTEIIYYSGSINYPSLYINNENDSSIVIFLPQALGTINEDYLLNIYLYLNGGLVKIKSSLDIEDYINENRFISFVGNEIDTILNENFNVDNEYSIRISITNMNSENERFYASSPIFKITKYTNGGGDTPGTGGGSSNITGTGTGTSTGTIDENGNINIDNSINIDLDTTPITDAIDKGNDYIMQDAVYDENGNLVEEQTGLIGKILQGFWNVLIKFFDWLMVPDEEQISDVVDDVLENDLISESVLGLPLQLITRFLNLFKNQTYTDWVISWDDVNFTFTEKDGSEIDMKMFNAYTFNISEFVRNDETLSEIYSYYLILVNFGAVCGLIYWGAGLVKGLMGIENEMPGANDETESPAVNSTPEESGESDAEALERWLGNNYNDYTHDYDEIRKRRLAKGLPNYGYKSQVVGRYKSILSDMKAGRYKKK